MAQPNMLGMRYDVDGKIWTDSAGHYDIFRLDVKTGAYERFEPMKSLPDSRPGTIYGVDSDSHNNLYFTDFATDYIGRIDAETKEALLVSDADSPFPPAPHQDRSAGPLVLRRISGQPHRNAGRQDGEDYRMAPAHPVVRSVLRGLGQERLPVYRRHDHGPPCAD